MTPATSPSTPASTTAATATGDGYHHGDLPNALRRAAAEVIVERGLGGFSLREVARRAGVSHTAPAHHFGDMKGLLTSLAEEGFDALHEAQTAALAEVGDDAPPAERLRAIGEAYVGLARSNPAHCEVMFRTDVVDADRPDLQQCGMRAYGVLEQTVQDLLDDEGLEIDPELAVRMCWATMQGLVVLAPKFELIHEVQGGLDPSTQTLVRRFTDVLVAGFRNAPDA